MTRTNLNEAAKADAKSAIELQAKVEALLAGNPPQKFTPPPPEPEPQHLVDTTYHEDTRKIPTIDLVGNHFVGPLGERDE